MPSARDIYQRNFRKEDFAEAPRAFTVKDVTKETFQPRDGHGKVESKLRMLFIEDDRGLIMSKTRVEDMIAITAADDYTKWPGTKVELFLDPTIRDPRGGRGGIAVRRPS